MVLKLQSIRFLKLCFHSANYSLTAIKIKCEVLESIYPSCEEHDGHSHHLMTCRPELCPHVAPAQLE